RCLLLSIFARTRRQRLLELLSPCQGLLRARSGRAGLRAGGGQLTLQRLDPRALLIQFLLLGPEQRLRGIAAVLPEVLQLFAARRELVRLLQIARAQPAQL